MSVIVSGIQPTGIKHLGNYFGAIQQHLELQESGDDCYFFIADYHALTSVNDPDELDRSRTELARTYLALGLDTDKAHIFRQSDVPEVTELAWLLATVTGMGLLQRAHSYKDKVAKGLTPNVGLFTYPVLMAADILAYGGTTIPVGSDQIQHVEMAQDMAQSFNARYGEVFVRPEPRLTTHAGARVVGLDGGKMSTSYGNTIPIFAEGKELKKLIASIKTDSVELGQPLSRDSPLFDLLMLFSRPSDPICDSGDKLITEAFATGRWEGEPFGYGHAKDLLHKCIEDHFRYPRKKAAELTEIEVETALFQGAFRAKARAKETLTKARHAVGLRQ